jgi:enoyl-CoA hydratase
MESELIHCEVRDHIARLAMDRPPVNAVHGQFLEELTRTFDTLSDRPDVGVAILTGAGRAFCAGADVKTRLERQPQMNGEGRSRQ